VKSSAIPPLHHSTFLSTSNRSNWSFVVCLNCRVCLVTSPAPVFGDSHVRVNHPDPPRRVDSTVCVRAPVRCQHVCVRVQPYQPSLHISLCTVRISFIVESIPSSDPRKVDSPVRVRAPARCQPVPVVYTDSVRVPVRYQPVSVRALRASPPDIAFVPGPRDPLLSRSPTRQVSRTASATFGSSPSLSRSPALLTVLSSVPPCAPSCAKSESPATPPSRLEQ
jgi:hypothetical protein